MRYLAFAAILSFCYSCATAPSGPVRSLHKVRANHVFSAPDREDQFVAVLRGSDTLTATVHLQILLNDRTVIYRDSFAAEALLDHGFKPDPGATVTDADRRAYIIQRLNGLFDSDRFTRPAYSVVENAAASITRQEVADYLEDQPQATAFYYLVGKGDRRYIAFYPPEDQAVVFFNCC